MANSSRARQATPTEVQSINRDVALRPTPKAVPPIASDTSSLDVPAIWGGFAAVTPEPRDGGPVSTR